ncbi:ketopantoate reductase C-terminal domain-containing protein [Bowmanella sp. JS7-9]|uniref:2-dehydropantoate 2-reductase n=1 Tax=Pseudobowmanella zhangzhouensis TaxID=1537679 RepID=A0ABW1XIE1_9ALTE|nr:ketopantoate reductase C-terminal domain-containing protein [Bowmanella sp. JS7-9]
MQIHVIYGAGLIGVYLAGLLRQALPDAKVLVVGRPSVLARYSKQLTLINLQGDSLCCPAPEVIELDNPLLKQADYVWLTCKTTALASVLHELTGVISDTCPVFTCQNGIGAQAMVAEQLPHNPQSTALIGCNVVLAGDDGLRQSSEGGLILEDAGLYGQLLPNWPERFWSLSLTDDMPAMQWAKLQLNLTNAVNALADEPLLNVLQQRAMRKVVASMMDELLAVCRGKQLALPRLTKVTPALLPSILRLPNWLFRRVAAAMLTIDPEARLSMWWDILQGRQTEIDFLQGAVVREAQSLGLAAPVCDRVYKAILKLQTGEAVSKTDWLG